MSLLLGDYCLLGTTTAALIFWETEELSAHLWWRASTRTPSSWARKSSLLAPPGEGPTPVIAMAAQVFLLLNQGSGTNSPAGQPGNARPPCSTTSICHLGHTFLLPSYRKHPLPQPTQYFSITTYQHQTVPEPFLCLMPIRKRADLQTLKWGYRTEKHGGFLSQMMYFKRGHQAQESQEKFSHFNQIKLCSSCRFCQNREGSYQMTGWWCDSTGAPQLYQSTVVREWQCPHLTAPSPQNFSILWYPTSPFSLRITSLNYVRVF